MRYNLSVPVVLAVAMLVLFSGIGFVSGVFADEDMSLEFNDQDDDDREVVVENVSNDDTTAALIIAYEDGDDMVIAATKPIPEAEGNGEDVSVFLVDTDSFPGEYTALILPLEELSDLRYAPSRTLSDDTLDAVLDQDEAFIDGDPPESMATNLDIAGQGHDATIEEGDDEDIEVQIENIGTTTQSFNAELFISDELVDTLSTSMLVPDEKETVTFENATGHRTERPTPAAVEIHTDDNGIGGSLVVEAVPPQAEFSDVDVAGQGEFATIDAGDDEDVSVNVTNVGGETKDFDILLQIGEDISGGDIDVEEEKSTGSIPPDESTTLTFEAVTGQLDPANYDVTISTDGATTGAALIVDPAETGSELTDVDIAGQGQEATIDEGADEDISVNVTNIGSNPETFDVTLELGDVNEIESTGELDEGEETTVAFTGVTEGLEPGTYSVEMESDDDAIEGSVTVEAVLNSSLSNLNIADQGSSAAIDEGDDEDITVDVTNDGGETQSFDVNLEIGTELDITESTDALAPDATETVTFESVTGTLDTDDYTVTVSTDDDSLSGSLAVESPAASALSALDIAGQDADATITEGANEDVAVTVTNVGGQGSSFDVTLSIGGAIDQTESTGTIRAGNTETITFESVTGDLDPDHYTVTVSTDDDSTTGDLTVEPGEATLSNLDIADQGDDATITEGENEDISVDVTNDGATTQQFTVELDIGGESWTETSGDIASGETDTVTFEAVTDGLEPGQYSVTVSASGDDITGVLTVEGDAPSELSGLDIAGQGATATVTAGENEDIAVVVANAGSDDTAVSFDVTLSIGEAVTETETSASIRGGQTDTVTFEGVTSDLDSDEEPYDVVVTTDDDEVSGELTVQTAATSSVSALDIAGAGSDATIVEGETEDVSVTVTNVGDVTDSFVVTLELDGETQTEETGELGASDFETVTFEAVTGALDAAETAYDVTVSTDDDATSGTLTVNAPGESSLSALDIADEGEDATISEGEQADVSVDVTNVGDITETFTLSLEIDGQPWTADSDPLDAGESDTVTFTDVTGELDGSETPYDVTVSTDDDEIAGTLTVEAPPEQPTATLSDINIAEQGADGTVLEGEDENIAVNVTNIGDESGSFSVSLDIVSQVQQNKTTDTLAAGETETVVFENATDSLAANNAAYGVNIETDDDDISGTVTVKTPPEPSLSNLDIAGQADDATIGVGADEDVSATVTNVGDAEGSFTVTLEIGDEITETVETDEVAGGTSETVVFENVTGELDIDTYDVTLSTEQTELTGELTVQELAPATSELTELDIAGQGESANVTGDEAVEVSVTVTNVGDLADSFEVSLSIGDAVAQTVPTDNLTGGDSEVVTFETDSLSPDTYDVSVSTADDTVEGNLTVLGPPPVAGDNSPTQAGFDDGLYRDIMGTGQLTIFDVQAFFNVYESDVVQENAAFFDFDGSGEITIGDVQELFVDLTETGG